MSHTFKGESCTIIHNGDYSSDVQIIGITGQSVVVSVEDLLMFAAEYVRQEKITKLEEADWREILLNQEPPRREG